MTTVTSSIQNVQAVNSPNVFIVDQLKLTLISTYPAEGQQPSIVPQVQFEGMTLNGKSITVNTDLDDFCRMSTLQSLMTSFKKISLSGRNIRTVSLAYRRNPRISPADSESVQWLCSLLVRQQHQVGRRRPHPAMFSNLPDSATSISAKS